MLAGCATLEQGGTIIEKKTAKHTALCGYMYMNIRVHGDGGRGGRSVTVPTSDNEK